MPNLQLGNNMNTYGVIYIFAMQLFSWDVIFNDNSCKYTFLFLFHRPFTKQKDDKQTYICTSISFHHSKCMILCVITISMIMFLDIFHPLLTRKMCCPCDIVCNKEKKCSYLYGHIDLREQQSYLTYYLHGQSIIYSSLKIVTKNRNSILALHIISYIDACLIMNTQYNTKYLAPSR